MLHTQPIKAPRTPQGDYISVMSRHTHSDGITPDEAIDLTNITHLPVLAPPARLVGDWYKGRLGARDEQTFQEHFAPRYIEWLDAHKDEVLLLGQRALTHDVTIMCIEPTPSSGELLLCHRRLLAEECLRLVDGLTVSIK